MSQMLAGKAAIVTGGARGIGQAAGLELARHGAAVAFFDLLPSDESAEEARKLGARALAIVGDVASRSDDERALAQVLDAFGRVDILVNNAAINIRKPLLDLEVDDVRRVWDVILWGTFHCTQLAARQMVRQGQGGNIVMISSVHAARPFPQSTSYNGAKAAVNHMAFTWAAELVQQGIRVNVIEPGWVDTPGERAYYTEEQIREEGSRLPMGRLAEPAEIARAVRFLVSGDASYITGTMLRVDGGFLLPARE